MPSESRLAASPFPAQHLRHKQARPGRVIVLQDPVKVFLPSPRKSVTTIVLALAFASGCGRGKGRVLEVMYVSAPQAFLRDRVAAIYNKTANVKNGDRLDVLDREKRFVKVRTTSGAEGWIEQRYVITQKVFDQFQ